MALTKAQVREILSEAGVSAEKMSDAVDKIIDGHVTSISALREQVEQYKSDAEKLPGVQKELDDLKANDADVAELKKQLTNKQKELDDFKKQVTEEKATAKKADLYRALLRECKVDEKRIESIMKITDLSGVTVKDDALENVDALKKAITTEWSGFIVTQKQEGSKVDTPPGKNEPSAFDSMSLADKMKFANEHPDDPTVTGWLNSK